MRLFTALTLAALAATTPLAAQAATLTKAEHAAVLAALDDEYLAATIYGQIIRKTGAERPFANIRRAELTHQSLLKGLLTDAGLPIPANPYASGAEPLPAIPATRAEACATGVAAEIANIKLYDDRLLAAVAGHPAAKAVMTKLRNDSRDRHLPAFQRCGSGGGMGGGKRGGRLNG